VYLLRRSLKVLYLIGILTIITDISILVVLVQVVKIERTEFYSISACPRNSEMEGPRELSDALNWREICLEDFQTCPRS